MNLYLVQHAQAKTKEEDPDRSLSNQGIAEITKVSAFAAQNCGMAIDAIHHSGKLRAKQTAAVLAEKLSLSPPNRG